MEGDVLMLLAMVILLLLAMLIVGKQLERVTRERDSLKAQVEELKKMFFELDGNKD